MFQVINNTAVLFFALFELVALFFGFLDSGGDSSLMIYFFILVVVAAIIECAILYFTKTSIVHILIGQSFFQILLLVWEFSQSLLFPKEYMFNNEWNFNDSIQLFIFLTAALTLLQLGKFFFLRTRRKC